MAARLLLAIGGAYAFGGVQTPSCRTAWLIINVPSAWLGIDALTMDGVLVQEKVAGIAATARANGIPVVFVKDIAYWFRFTDQQLKIAPPLAIIDGDYLVEKKQPNGFAGTSLAELLRNMGVTTLLITGYASHECVSATVAGASARGFQVIITADGHSGGQRGFWAKKQNRFWTEKGLQVVLSTEIDFASLCASPDPQAGGQSARPGLVPGAHAGGYAAASSRPVRGSSVDWGASGRWMTGVCGSEEVWRWRERTSS